MANKPEQWDADYAIPRSDSTSSDSTSIKTEYHASNVHQEGYVTTPHGYVYVGGRAWLNSDKSTRLEFIHDGRLHIRQIREIYQPRHLVTLAKRFAAEIAAKGGNE